MVKPDQNSSKRSKYYVFSNERLSLRVILENMERSHWFEKIMHDADFFECCKKCKLKNHFNTDGRLLTFKSLTCILFTIIFFIFLLHSSALEYSATVHPQNLTNWIKKFNFEFSPLVRSGRVPRWSSFQPRSGSLSWLRAQKILYYY